MTIEYCPRCQSYQIMRVTITKSVDTIARRINVGKTGMAAYVGNNGKVISIEQPDGRIIDVNKNGKALTVITKCFYCSKCNTFVKSVKSENESDHNLR